MLRQSIDLTTPSTIGIALPTVRRSAIKLLCVRLCRSERGAIPTWQPLRFFTDRRHSSCALILNRKLDLRAYRGKVVLLDFWATWCASCQIAMPSFVAWQSKYGPGAYRSSASPWSTTRPLLRSMVSKLKLNYSVAMGDVKLGDLYGGVLGLPISFLIDRHGVIQAEYQGEADLNKIEKQMQSLLSGR